MPDLSLIRVLWFAVGCLGLGGAVLLFYFGYDIGKDGRWREDWPFVVVECFLGSIALLLAATAFLHPSG